MLVITVQKYLVLGAALTKQRQSKSSKNRKRLISFAVRNDNRLKHIF
jgi:hypothetical protein